MDLYIYFEYTLVCEDNPYLEHIRAGNQHRDLPDTQVYKCKHHYDRQHLVHTDMDLVQVGCQPLQKRK